MYVSAKCVWALPLYKQPSVTKKCTCALLFICGFGVAKEVNQDTFYMYTWSIQLFFVLH